MKLQSMGKLQFVMHTATGRANTYLVGSKSYIQMLFDHSSNSHIPPEKMQLIQR